MQTEDINAIALLADPTRRRIYEAVSNASGPIDRDGVAAAAAVDRSLAAFHLDRLVAGGLLHATYARRGGRSGPGAGRPAKFYERVPAATVSVSVPERQYRLAAEILATTEPPRPRVLATARERGRDLATAVDDATSEAGGSAGTADRERLETVLDGLGLQPRETPDGGIAIANCPFVDLVTDHRDVACGMHLALLEGVTSALPGAGLQPRRLDPPQPCCVTLVPVDASAASSRRAAERAPARRPGPGPAGSAPQG